MFSGCSNCVWICLCASWCATCPDVCALLCAMCVLCCVLCGWFMCTLRVWLCVCVVLCVWLVCVDSLFLGWNVLCAGTGTLRVCLCVCFVCVCCVFSRFQNSGPSFEPPKQPWAIHSPSESSEHSEWLSNQAEQLPTLHTDNQAQRSGGVIHSNTHGVKLGQPAFLFFISCCQFGP